MNENCTVCRRQLTKIHNLCKSGTVSLSEIWKVSWSTKFCNLRWSLPDSWGYAVSSLWTWQNQSSCHLHTILDLAVYTVSLIPHRCLPPLESSLTKISALLHEHTYKWLKADLKTGGWSYREDGLFDNVIVWINKAARKSKRKSQNYSQFLHVLNCQYQSYRLFK